MGASKQELAIGRVKNQINEELEDLTHTEKTELLNALQDSIDELHDQLEDSFNTEDEMDVD